MNKVMLIGTITKDIDFKKTNDSTMAKFSLAVRRNVKNKEGNYDSDFINCIAWNKTAELINTYFKKGSKIGLTGRIQTGSYTNKNNQKVYTTDVLVEDIDFIDKKADSTTQSKPVAKEESGFDANDGFTSADDLELPFK